jgi:hypothetical protein
MPTLNAGLGHTRHRFHVIQNHRVTRSRALNHRGIPSHRAGTRSPFPIHIHILIQFRDREVR